MISCVSSEDDYDASEVRGCVRDDIMDGSKTVELPLILCAGAVLNLRYGIFQSVKS